MATQFVHAEILGLREFQARVRNMLGPEGVPRIQRELAAEFGPQLEAVYRAAAPKSLEGQLASAQLAAEPLGGEATRMRQAARRRTRRDYKVRTGHAIPKGRTGPRFAESINWSARTAYTNFQIAVTTAQPDKRRWLYQGTGIYGPSGQRIFPKSAKALAFMWNGQPMIRRSIAGMKSQKEWELKAMAGAMPIVGRMGLQMGVTIVGRLSDKGKA